MTYIYQEIMRSLYKKASHLWYFIASFIFKGNTNNSCKTIGSIGCIYKELLDGLYLSPVSLSDTYAKIEKFSIDLSPKSNSAEMVDIQVCVHGCRSLFPYDSFIHFGVRWDAVNSNIECWCLMSDTFDTSMIGPQVKIL